MSDIVLISRAIDHFEGNLKGRCQVADMASSASYSLYHFCRMFNKCTHHTPYDYMMRRRLSEAARELVGTNRKILDIALDFQFNSHETFARAFKRMFGQQPRRFRAQGRIGRWQLMPRLTLDHLRQIAKGPYLSPGVEESESFTITGIMAIVREETVDPPDQWRLFTHQLQSLSPVPSHCRYYGITFYADDGSAGEELYMTGIRARASDSRHNAWVEKKIPAHRYATFTHKGPPGDLNLTLDYVFHTWLAKSGEAVAWPCVIEHHGHRVAEEGDWDTELPVSIPIKPVAG